MSSLDTPPHDTSAKAALAKGDRRAARVGVARACMAAAAGCESKDLDFSMRSVVHDQ